MASADALDLTNLPRFLDYLRTKTPDNSRFAQTLLDAGWTPHEFWGPEQMDVWQLDLLRDGWLVRFRIERGYAEAVRVVRHTDPPQGFDAFSYVGLAIVAWARHHDRPFRLSDPDDWDHDLEAYGVHALEWLAGTGGPVLDRVSGEWLTYRHSIHARSADLDGLRADSLQRMEAAARR